MRGHVVRAARVTTSGGRRSSGFRVVVVSADSSRSSEQDLCNGHLLRDFFYCFDIFIEPHDERRDVVVAAMLVGLRDKASAHVDRVSRRNDVIADLIIR